MNTDRAVSLFNGAEYDPPKIHMLRPNPQCDDIWMWGLCEVVR